MNKIPLKIDQTKSFDARLDEVENHIETLETDNISFINQVNENNNDFKNETNNSVSIITSQLNERAKIVEVLTDYPLPNADVTVTTELQLNNSVKVVGNKKYKRLNTNASLNGDLKIGISDIGIDGLNLDGQSQQAIYWGNSNIKNVTIQNSNITTKGHGVHVNTASVEDITIKDTNIIADGYGILTNGNAKNGKNLLITGCKVISNKADAIELNNPSSSTTDTWKGVKIIGNDIMADTGSTGSTAGFAIGIAKTRDVVVIGNTIRKSRNEALHIEDDQENVVVTGNIFNGCVSDGARILKGGFSGSGQAKPVIVTNNHFVKDQIAKTNCGILRVYDGSGALDSILNNNYIRGFDIGLYLDGNAISSIEGCYIEDCNTVIKQNIEGISHGTITAKNCPTLAIGHSSSVFDKIISITTPTTLLSYIGTSGNIGSTLKGFAFPIGSFTTVNGTNLINLFNLPTRLQGKLIAKIRNGFDFIYICSDVVYDGTTLTLTNKVSQVNGNLNSPNFVINSGKLALSVGDYGSNHVLNNINIDFDGIYYQA